MQVRSVQSMVQTGPDTVVVMLVSQTGEDLCLAFANTLAWRGRAAPVENFTDFAAVLTWAETNVALPDHLAAELRGWAREHPSKTTTALAEAVSLREAIHGIAGALACGEPVGSQDFAALSQALSEAPARRHLSRSGTGYAWQIELGSIGGAGLPIPVLLAPVVWSAADLMVGSGRRRIRQCANSECLWLFVDESKNGTRRWCDMASCGNRAKARRHYLKTKQS
jgi:predicted RNA-binding Zn ribbon-like protein